MRLFVSSKCGGFRLREKRTDTSRSAPVNTGKSIKGSAAILVLLSAAAVGAAQPRVHS